MKFIRAFVFVLYCTLLLEFSTKINAQDTPPVPPNPVACDNVASPEFHSLRPYQKNSSCQSETANYAKFCGNTLTLQEIIEKTYVPGDPNCKTTGSKITCSYTEKVPSHLVTIDLSGANLPIMGNTEKVTNYKGEADKLTDAQKVNEYVSWYLNGVTNKKEYSPTEDGSQIINFTGPINKLLPSEIQEKSRIATVKNAGVARHDQIVGCVDLFGLGKISACEANNILQKRVRLSDWKNNLPPERSEFSNDQDYWIRYRKWRGEACIKIAGMDFCADVPWKANWPGNLFSYVPLSSTEDLEGNIKVDSVSAGSAGVTGIQFNNQSPSTLFFPHIQESDELGSILQDTYIGKGQAKTGTNTAVAQPSSCTTVDVRSNKGDNLFAGEIVGNLSYTASFTCDFNPLPSCSGTCVPSLLECKDGKGKPGTGSCNGNRYCCNFPNPAVPPAQTCNKTINVALSTQSNTPKIDDVWSRLVGGPTAVVKRLFPKLGSQIGTLKDIPGSTSISYNGAASSGELNLPHIGGISEYFLKGIQTLLRPKGYGEPISFGSTTTDTKTKFGDICAVANKYKIPCCVLKGIVEVETGNNPIFMGTDSCNRNGKPFSCCNGNYCGPANIACNQYLAWNGNDDLDLCDPTESAELLARALLFKLCQADNKCGSGWATDGDYILENYSIGEGDYTAAAYFYGLANGCGLTACSQFRWGEGKGYCDSVKSYCETGKALESNPTLKYCAECRDGEMKRAGVKLDCSTYK